MKVQLVITATGPDRPGVIDRLARTVLEHRGNWEESRMAHLSGMFAGIIQISVPAEHTESLIFALKGLASPDLAVRVEKSEPGGLVRDQAPMTVEVSGGDHEGIVHEFSQVLAERRVNIEELTTSVTEAPMSGARLFTANFRIRVPPTLAADDLRRVLEEQAAKTSVEVRLDRADT